MKFGPFQDNGSLNLAWANAVIEQLLASGVKTICISPGYRNSPLILAAQKHPEMECVSILDERGSAFFALGLAKRLHEPVAIASTSGTACANFFPAILEAKYSHTSLVVITADRPQELVGLGANQTMNQYNLYGAHVNYFANIAAPSEENPNFEHLVYEVSKTVLHSKDRVRGPVHLNISFEEPLLPKAEIDWNLARIALPIIKNISAPLRPTENQISELVDLLSTKENKVLFLVPGDYSSEFASHLIDFCNYFQILLLAEPASGIGFGAHSVAAKSLFGNVEDFINFFESQKKSSQLFIRVGAPLISKRIHNFFNRQKNIPLLLLDEFREMRNPALGNTIYVDGNPVLWIQKLAQVDKKYYEYSAENLLIKEFRNVSKKTAAEINNKINQSAALTEWSAVRDLILSVPENTNIFLGNSMPIRDFNSVVCANTKKITLYHNRGLSGIDGLIASAVGVSFKNKNPTYLWIGDLSAIHDIGSLAIAKNLASEINLTICILNNQGGDIFRSLATKQFPEAWFTTPQCVDFEKIMGGFGIDYSRADSKNSFLEKIKMSALQVSSQVRCIEIVPNLEINARIRES